LLAAPDTFRGTASAHAAAQAMADAAREAGWDVVAVPVSDGGEGLLECLGGANRASLVTDPLGRPVSAAWLLDGRIAVLEMAQASGLALLGEHLDPLAASTSGTGELVATAIRAGAGEIVLGLGGSATTDGGAGAVAVLREFAPLDGSRGWRVRLAADVTTSFVDAATRFGPQKGADAAQVRLLTDRLTALAARYRDEFGIDLTQIPGSGAAGGLAGGLLALGASIEPGFDVVAERLALASCVAAADLVLTGEGSYDETSRLGKATSGVLRLAALAGVPGGLIAGRVTVDPPPGTRHVDLSARYGRRAANAGAEACIRAAASGLLRAFRPGTWS
jgi:glycerate kinase